MILTWRRHQHLLESANSPDTVSRVSCYYGPISRSPNNNIFLPPAAGFSRCHPISSDVHHNAESTKKKETFSLTWDAFQSNNSTICLLPNLQIKFSKKKPEKYWFHGITAWFAIYQYQCTILQQNQTLPLPASMSQYCKHSKRHLLQNNHV